MFFNAVVAHMQAYCVTRDAAELNAARVLLEREIEKPDLQKAVIDASFTEAEIEAIVTAEKSLKLDPCGIRGAVIENGKLIRVMAKDQAEGTALMLRVAYTDSKIVVLVPL
jgi:hypothetical protein